MAVASTNTDQLIGVLRDTIVGLVRRDGVDLSSRQLGVFLTCYLRDGGHTVRGLAAELNVSKPAITRALDRLGELDLARRKVDPLDRRSVLVRLNPAKAKKMQAFYREVNDRMTVLLDETPERELRSLVNVLSKMNASRVEGPPS